MLSKLPIFTLSWRQTLFNDVLASFVVFLVALPLCMGIAIASGLTPASGIVTGIIGGMIISLVGGCPLQISGPAAGLAVIVLELIKEHGLHGLGIIIATAGAIQLLAGYLKLATWFRAVPPSVIHGMLSGIGVLIFASQFHVMVDDVPKENGVFNLLSIPLAIWKGLLPNSTTSHEEAYALGLTTILVLLGWDRFVKGPPRVIPGSLVAVVVATLAAYLMKAPVHYVALPKELLKVISFPNWQYLTWHNCRELALDGFVVALIASAETLLTCSALDKMHHGPRTNYDRELKAQGLGNMLCGLFGVPPMTGVMVRSGVNVTAGARTRLSAVLHGLWLLLFASFLPFVVNHIPISSLAALLVYTGYKLADFQIAKKLWKFGRSEVAIYAATVVSIVSIDLLSGVIVGVVLAIAKLLYAFSHLEIRVVEDVDSNRTQLWLRGAATFLSLPKFASILEQMKASTELHIHLEALDYIDHACLDLLMNWDKQHQAKGGTVVIDWSILGTVFRDRRRRSRGVAIKQFRQIREPSLNDSEDSQNPDIETSQRRHETAIDSSNLDQSPWADNKTSS